jgi:prevent-host-death family protein
MRTYSITDTKTHLSRLVQQAVNGEPFLITKSGKPMVKVVAADTPAPSKKKRFGFMAGQIKVPADFNCMGVRKIERQFAGK